MDFRRSDCSKVAGFWRLRTQTISFENGPVFMGIVNVTPDSFSDGGRYLDTSAAVDRALRLIERGAGIVDVGGESTRPGSDGVDTAEELRRVVPAITAIREAIPGGKPVAISVDTTKAAVAVEAIRAGAEIVNDVFSAEDPGMIPLLLESGAAVCIMHRQGNPKTMQRAPVYDDVVEDVFEFLRRRRDELIAAGIDAEKIAVDPGLGFGKTAEHNWTLVDCMERFHELGAPLLVGHSRKRFLALRFEDRDAGTEHVTDTLLAKRVQVIRLHEMPAR